MDTEIITKTAENLILNGTKNDVPHTQQSTMVTEVPSGKKSKVTTSSPTSITDGVLQLSSAGDSKSNIIVRSKSDFPIKNKRKRRRGKPKTNTKPYKKSNWKFQMPRCRNGNGMRCKLARSRSIVPYNTNKFLMEEHMAEVTNALLTPTGRTRDSSFSVDSEDNYFFSLPEDEEEFLSKEFANVYERARVERLEGMTKQQLIEECLQLEDRYAQGAGAQQNGNTEYLAKLRVLEERIRDLNAENLELRRKLDYNTSGAINLQPERMSSTSEDSESDSSSSSSCASSEYSRASHRSSLSCDLEQNDSRMDSDDIVTGPYEQITPNSSLNYSSILCNGHAKSLSPRPRSGSSSPTRSVNRSPSSPASPTTEQAQQNNIVANSIQ